MIAGAGHVDGDGVADFLVRTNILVDKSDFIFDDARADLASGLGQNGALDFVRPADLPASR